MLQSLILVNLVDSAMIMKLDQDRRCKNKTRTNHEISVKHAALPHFCGTFTTSMYKFAFYALIDAEICSMTNSNSYIELYCFFNVFL